MRIALVDDSEIERGIALSLITDYGCEKQILFESDCFDSGDLFLLPFRLINTMTLWTFL